MRLGFEVLIGVLEGRFDDWDAWIGLEMWDFSSSFVKLQYGPYWLHWRSMEFCQMTIVFDSINGSFGKLGRDVNQELGGKRFNFGSCRVNWNIRHIVV